MTMVSWNVNFCIFLCIELESEIEQIREVQRKYSNLLRLSRALTSHFYHVVQTQVCDEAFSEERVLRIWLASVFVWQHALGEAFTDLSQKSPDLQEEFVYNAETQRSLTRNGEALLGALNFFVSSVNTLCNKTIEDTLLTIRLYEAAR